MKKKSKVTIFTDLAMVIMLFFCFLCGIISDKYTIMSRMIFLNVFSNFESGPIVEIDISRWRCKSGFSPLFNYSYPGHDSACYDNSTGIFALGTSKEECLLSKTSNNKLIYIEETQPTEMIAWRSKVVCVKRDYAHLNKSVMISSERECPENYKYCGNVNNFNDKYCILAKYQCPIFYLDILPKTKVNKSDTSIQYVSLDNSFMLVYSNNSTEKLQEGIKIKIDFKVGFDYPCIKRTRIPYQDPHSFIPMLKKEAKSLLGCKPPSEDANEHQIMNMRIYEYNNNNYKDLNRSLIEPNYVPLKNAIVGNTSNQAGEEVDESIYSDKRYSLMDSYFISEFNNDNDLKYLNDIPNLKDWVNNKRILLNLYSRPFVTFNLTCLNMTDFSIMKSTYTDIKVMHYIINILLLVNLISLCLHISILSLMKITSRNQNLILSIIKIIQSLIFMYFIAKQIFKLRDKDDKLQQYYKAQYLNESCLDQVTRNGFDKIYHFKDGLSFRESMIELIYYTGFPYLACIVIQFLKFLHKVYLRLRNKKRNIQAKSLFGLLGQTTLPAKQ